MKIGLSILAAVLIIGGVFFFFFRSPSAPLTETSATTTSSVSTAGTNTAATASVLEKTLLLTRTGASSQEVLASSGVVEGDTLRTLTTGRGVLQEADGTATLLDYDTTMTVHTKNGEGTHVSNYLASGSVWARVKKVFGQGEFYEIETQNAVAVVRGTSFGVGYQNKLTTLQVAEGKVGLIPVDPSTRARLLQKEVVVKAGSKATIDDAGKISVSPLTAADKKAEWYLFNMSAPTIPSAAPAATASGSLIGTYTVNSLSYVHTMNITKQDPRTGVISGTGFLTEDPSYAWTMVGTTTGTGITIHGLYTGATAGFTFDLIGAIAADGSMSGAITTSLNQRGTWAAVKGAKLQ